jgi:PAS domain-containing protein
MSMERVTGENELELALAGRALRLLFEQIPGAAWLTDRALRVESAMGQWRPGVRLDSQRVIGSTVQQITSVSPEHPVLLAHARALEGVSSSLRFELDSRCFQVQVEPVRDHSGKIKGCLGVAIDATDKLQVDQQLQASESKLADAQRFAHIGSWEWDVVTNHVGWSDELYNIYALPPEQFAGTFEAFLERVVPEERERTRAVVFDAYRKIEPFIYDHRIVRPDGQVRTLHTRGDVISDATAKCSEWWARAGISPSRSPRRQSSKGPFRSYEPSWNRRPMVSSSRTGMAEPLRSISGFWICGDCAPR